MHSIKLTVQPAWLLYALFCTLVIAGWISALQSYPVEASMGRVDKSDINNKIKFVNYLLTESPLQRRVRVNGDSDLSAAMDKAQNQYQQSTEAFEQGRMEEASELIKQVIRDLHGIANTLSEDQSEQAQYKERFDEMYKAVMSLRNNFGNGVMVNQGKQEETNARISSARESANAGLYKKGIDELGLVYDALSKEVSDYYGDKTLYYALNFESEKEEYEYDMRRYRSYRMLLMTVKEGKMDKSSVSGLIKGYIKESEKIKKQAQFYAETDDFTNAIRLMNNAFAMVERALRVSGSLLPDIGSQ